MSNTTTNKTLILKYWRSWQKPDWEEMRSCLADEINFGGHTLSSDDFVNMFGQGNPREKLVLLSEIYNDEGGALLYEGLDTGSKRTIRVGEFIQVRNDKIVSSIASFGTGEPPN